MGKNLQNTFRWAVAAKSKGEKGCPISRKGWLDRLVG